MLFCESEAEPAARSRAMTARMKMCSLSTLASCSIALTRPSFDLGRLRGSTCCAEPGPARRPARFPFVSPTAVLPAGLRASRLSFRLPPITDRQIIHVAIVLGSRLPLGHPSRE